MEDDHHSEANKKGGSTEKGILLDFWLLTYWSSYVLNWIIIPLLQGYVVAGEFSAMKRVQRAIIMNVPYFFLYFFSFITLLVIIVVIDNNSKGEKDYNLLADGGILNIIIALSLSFGFFLLVCLLGYALVKIPIKYWINSDITERLKRLHFKVAFYEE